MQVIEVSVPWIGPGDAVDRSPGGDAIAFHAGDDAVLRPGGAGDHQHRDDDSDGDRTEAESGQERAQGQHQDDDRTSDESLMVQNVEALCDDGAGGVCVGEGIEGGISCDGEKKQSAQPDSFTTNTAAADSTSITTSLTTNAAGDLVVQGLWSYGNLEAGLGATPIVVDAAFTAVGIFASTASPVSSAGSVSMTTLSNGAASTGVVMASFAPAQ